MGQAIRVLLVDDHEFAREGLRRMLELEPGIEVVGEASGGQEALSLVDPLAPDVVLMDIKMPDMNGLEATRYLKQRANCEVVILSLYDEYLAQAMEAGAGGYLTKDVKRTELATAVRRVYKGELVLGANLLANSQTAEAALKQLREVVRSRQASDPGSEAKSFPIATRTPPNPRPEPGAMPPLGLQATPRTDTGGAGQDSQIQSQLPEVPPASSPQPWEPAPWAVPLETVEPPVPPRRQREPAAASAAPLSPSAAPPTVADLDDDDEHTPFARAGKVAATKEQDLVLPPPVSAARMMRFCHRLEEASSAKIVGTGGSWAQGVFLKVALHKSISLLEVLQLMPEVAEVWEESTPNPEDGRGALKGRGKKQALPPAKKQFHVMLKEATDPAQLAFRL